MRKIDTKDRIHDVYANIHANALRPIILITSSIQDFLVAGSPHIFAISYCINYIYYKDFFINRFAIIHYYMYYIHYINYIYPIG
ncbi:hypothetical protein RclHR1_02830015 [Rhizophagus clarus]|uniref:Uncharacterized protein n=1 Tax=Rhizophagus clarus TaxID=94130 RepID=A0A2Z6RHA4_9GLOM|nr:hypothetical protein RclHR1_02830015 [Rhizophagus clarus]